MRAQSSCSCVRRPTRRGITLLELMVSLAILGVIAGIVGVGMQPQRSAAAPGGAADVGKLRRRAIETGERVSGTTLIDETTYALTALPDGSVIAPRSLAVDRLTGRIP